MGTYDNFYDINPVATLDQNKWDQKMAELVVQFRQQPVIYTPLIDWDNTQQQTGAEKTITSELLEGDTGADEIPFAANYIPVTVGVDSRSRFLRSTRYGDKVQMHESSNIFQQWQFSGGRDWRPLLRGLLGSNFIRKHELLARNAHLIGPKDYWTYAGSATDFGTIGATDVFSLEMINEWRLRLGNTGHPVIPGDAANAKVCILPPSATYDFMKQIPLAATNETSLWRDASLYAGRAINYEIGEHKGVRFVEVPNNRYGENLSILYNAGAITAQYGVSSILKMGDGSPDPETATVDGVWAVGQKNKTHYIQLQSDADMSKLVKDDIITIHVDRTNEFGVKFASTAAAGVDFRKPKTIERRIVSVSAADHRICVDRPVMFDYDASFSATPFGTDGTTCATLGTYYAFVTKARHIGFALVLGSRGGIRGSVARPVKFYEPKPIDDFESVWRFVWDEYTGYNIWEPNLFEPHFFAVSLPKPGGIIAP